jgi:NADH pyrophosphatase NudC (nudix superfamily)
MIGNFAMEQRYIITESELKSFHMAAVLSSGENKLAQQIVDEIRSRKISDKCGSEKTPNNTTKAKICPEFCERVRQLTAI